ncbi:hypothetical protein NBH19_08635 [Rhizobium sp. S95]|uniref:Uncharacterized protein n=1 Tax=Ciceribacter sichuanensis TaxID=2949647 RepID=A0AAJ1BYB3_9HYPH|nr:MULTISPECIES: hypothetical protein [unclassified Ciceribacter]MCM2396144.1 hypothetical protein [Ciceribacter sp. S95]MCO5957705.1 hypothetical protein [Ciceribacter sp. S101]
MLKLLSDIAPKAAVAAVVLWAGANYLVIGPEVATRVVRADHLPMCQRNFSEMTLNAAKRKAEELPPPAVDASKEMAASQLRALQDNPMMQELNRMGLGQAFGIDQTLNMSLRQYEEQKRAAIEAYNRSVERIKADTATTLGKAGDVCGCVADTAISETRTEWAIFSGTLGLIRPAPLKAFDERMAQTFGAGVCSAKAGA